VALLPLARLVALIDQTTDRNAVQASHSSGRRISAPLLPLRNDPDPAFRVVGWFSRRGLAFLSDSVGCLIRAHAQAAAARQDGTAALGATDEQHRDAVSGEPWGVAGRLRSKSCGAAVGCAAPTLRARQGRQA
jgi:hypothetical protein